MPEPKWAFELIADVNNQMALSSAKEFYSREMESIFEGDECLSGDQFENRHLQNKDGSIKIFNDHPKMGGKEFSTKFKLQVRKVHNFFVRVEVRPGGGGHSGKKAINLCR
jgi:hypothetical protein